MVALGYKRSRDAIAQHVEKDDGTKHTLIDSLGQGDGKAMQQVGYKEDTKLLTRGQVKVIVRFLGEP